MSLLVDIWGSKELNCCYRSETFGIFEGGWGGWNSRTRAEAVFQICCIHFPVFIPVMDLSGWMSQAQSRALSRDSDLSPIRFSSHWKWKPDVFIPCNHSSIAVNGWGFFSYFCWSSDVSVKFIIIFNRIVLFPPHLSEMPMLDSIFLPTACLQAALRPELLNSPGCRHQSWFVGCHGLNR